VHLAGSMPWPPTSELPAETARRALGGLFNVVQAAQEWGVTRVAMASTIGVYTGLTTEGGLSEDTPLPMTAPHVIPTFKKIAELLNAHLAGATGIEIVNCRISGTWGPLGHGGLFFAAPELIHAAVDGRAPDLSGLRGPAYAESGLDLCYVKDIGRAVALLQLTETLNHATYNVASGRVTSNAEVAAAIRKVIPDAQVDLPTGGEAARSHLDTERAAADYIEWLRVGNER
jgi:UDP-glucose 4-epimerase